MTDVSILLSADLADRYRLDRELGHGGMATVYLAHDLKHDRAVALKVLRPELASTLGPERFLREITLTAQLNHPHILPLLDSGQAPDASGAYLYYVMPYVEGESLRDRLNREKQLPLEDALQITREVADALSYAHGHHVIHRDIKPENILLESGHAVVADFGIARAISAAGGEKLTETGLAVGTPAYMSPEQAAGERELDGRSDEYALGCVLYEMLAGQPPFTGATAESIVRQHIAAPAPNIMVIRPAVPTEVAAALQRAMAKAPADRYGSVASFLAGLTAAFTLPAGDQSLPGRTGTWPGPRRLRWLVAAAAAAVVSGATLTAVLLRRQGLPAGLDPQLIAVMPFRAASPMPALRELAGEIPDIFWTKITGEFGPRATDPATTARAWQHMGGTAEAGLPKDAELRIARDQGAGLLVRGVITGTGDSATITAELLEVPSGHVRVPPTAVHGAADRWIPLMDTLVVLLLVKDFGVAAERIPSLSRYSSRAIRAYLAALRAGRRYDFGEAQRLLVRALEVDSTFLLAAVLKYDLGETDTAVAQYVWAHQDQLAPQVRATFRAQAGWRFGVERTEADIIARWESLTAVSPDYGKVWYELGEHLWIQGALAGEPHWRERARAAFERVIRVEAVPAAQTWWRLYRLAITDTLQDTAAIQRYFDRYRAASDPRKEYSYLRWQIALHRGDRAEAARRFPTSADRPDGRSRDAWAWLMVIALEDGMGVVDADRAATLTDDQGGVSLVWARARGRHAEWLRLRDDVRGSATRRAVLQLRDALFLGETEDSAVEAAARLMANIAAGRTEGSLSLSDRVAARCWNAVWRLRHGDSLGASAAARYLRAEVPLPYKFPVCAGLIDVLLTRARKGEVRTSVKRWDSVVRPMPVPPNIAWREDGTRGLDNLLLARLLLQVGDTSGALAAARRRAADISVTIDHIESVSLLVDYLREEGRLAALTGDRAGAIRAYTRYLALREDPDYPPWRVVRDSVRAELAALMVR